MTAAGGYRQDIQGLRAIAVVSVLLFHAFPEALPGGYVGVDIFFVISGFLISGILYRDIAAGRFSIADFYRKRIRRLFPALFVVLILTLVAGYVILPPFEYRELARNTISSTLFLSNIDFYLLSGYFSPAAELKPLLHTWSLSVEEQFYIVFPLLLWALATWLPRGMLATFVLIFALSLVASQWALSDGSAKAYYLTPFRVYELILGVLVALMPLPEVLAGTRIRGIAVAAGLAMIVLATVAFTPQTPFPGVAALLPTAGTALVLLAGRGGESLPGRLISLPPFLFFGAISYSLYLWHWPVLAYLRLLDVENAPEAPAVLLALSGIVAGAALSYRYVEMPFQRRSTARTPFLGFGLAGMAAMCLLAVGIRSGGGLPARFNPETLRLFEAAQDFSPHRQRCHRNDRPMHYEQTCVLGAENVAPDVAVYGDSHGTELAFVLGEVLGTEGRALRQITSSGCPPTQNVVIPNSLGCAEANTVVLRGLVQEPAIRTVILATNAEAYLERVTLDALLIGLRTTVEELTTAGKRVIIMDQLPNMGFDPAKAAGYAALFGGDPAKIGRARAAVLAATEEWRTALAQLAQDTGQGLYDPMPLICDDQLCPVVDSGETVLYFNATHISLAGARVLARDMTPRL